MLIDYSYFTGTYLGVGVLETDFPRLELRAEEVINAITRGAVDNIAEYSEKVQTLIKKAVCSQTEYYGQYSTEIGFSAESEGFTVGKVSVNGGSQDVGVKNYICPRALIYLEQTGLLTRAVGILC